VYKRNQEEETLDLSVRMLLDCLLLVVCGWDVAWRRDESTVFLNCCQLDVWE
jgi:hypothetical protein